MTELGVVLDGANSPSTAADVAELLARLANLERQLASQPQIERAKGVLMAVYGVDADAAFDLLRRHSQQNNIKLRVVAADFLDRLGRHDLGPQPRAQVDAIFRSIATAGSG